MILYHYSNELYPRLETKEYRGEKIKDYKPASDLDKFLGNYNQHISFFLDPIPTSIMGKIYGKEHHTWFPGNVLYQYEIDSSTIGNFRYYLVETPEKLKLFYDDTLTDEEYYIKYHKVIKDHLLIGSGNDSLERASKPYLGKTRSSIENVNKVSNWDSIKNKYAAAVTHLMLYPASGIINYSSYNKVKIK